MLILGKNTDFLSQTSMSLSQKVLFFRRDGRKSPQFDGNKAMGGLQEQPWKNKTKDELADLSPDHLLAMAEHAEELGEGAQYAAPQTPSESVEALRMHELHKQVLAEDEKAKAEARKQMELAAQLKDDALTGRNQEKVIVDPALYAEAEEDDRKTGRNQEKVIVDPTLYKEEEQKQEDALATSFFAQGDRGRFSEKAVTQYQTKEANDTWQRSVEPIRKKITRLFKKLFRRK